MFWRFVLLTAIALLTACASTPPTTVSTDAVHEYCGDYFIYSLCASDYTGDGEVDAVYFIDTKEIFLFRPEAEELASSKLPFHQCAFPMDEELMLASNRLLEIDDDTSYFRKSQIKSGLFTNYLRYAPRVNKCNNEHGKEIETVDDDFHDFDYDDYDD